MPPCPFRTRAVATLIVLLLAVGAGVAHAQTVTVPTFTAGAPTPPNGMLDADVAVGPDGSIVVLWVEVDGHHYKTGRALLRRFSAAGLPLGDARRVDTTEWANADVATTLDVDTYGGFIGAWNILEVAGSGYIVELYGRRFDGTGAPVGLDFEMPFEEGGDVALTNTGDAAAGLPSGTLFAWIRAGRVWAQLVPLAGEPAAPFVVADLAGTLYPQTLDVDRTPDGGFVVAWSDVLGGTRRTHGRVYGPDIQPRGLPFLIEPANRAYAIAASPLGGFATVSSHVPGTELWLRRFDAEGILLGEESIATAPNTMEADLAFDPTGNLLVMWSMTGGGAYAPCQARVYDAGGTPLGPAFAVNAAKPGHRPRVAGAAGGGFVVLWLGAAGAEATGLSLCAPGIATCGDGVWDSRCEQCDDGASNSDVVPDACRTDCRRAGCADSVLDTNEGCDDGNRTAGDCCSPHCALEPDFDHDGVCDPGDNCALFPNPDQSDAATCDTAAYGRLAAAETERFQDGLRDFAEIELAETGLGPVFNGTSCAECHNRPTIGGSSPRVVTRFGRDAAGGGFDPMAELGGLLLQAQGVTTPSCSVAGEVLPPTATYVGTRESPPLFGLGLVDAIADERILKLADPTDRNGDGVSGRPNLIGGRVGRFGWKAQTATLLEFTASAYLQEIGITSPALPSEILPQGGAVTCDGAPDPEDDGSGVAALSDFITRLAPLPPTAKLTKEERYGRGLFKRARCTVCHTDKLKSGASTLSPLHKKRVRLFSDLLLHDMGPGLTDGIVEGQATGSEFRTAPLWGARASAPYLHDGRAATLGEAIAAHGGEGAAARDAFLALPAADQAALLAFLGSL